jgi:hypothetical protein
MVNEWTDISCPSACDQNLFYTSISVDQDCTLVPPLSQVSDLYIEPDGATTAFSFPSAAGSNPTGILSAIDNTNTANTRTKHLVGRGGVEAPEEEIYEGAKLKRIISKRVYTLTFEVNLAENGMYNLLRQLQCGGTSFKFRYGTLGGYLLGGSQGITPNFVTARMPLDASNEGRQVGTIVIEFETVNGDPPRHVNPFA